MLRSPPPSLFRPVLPAIRQVFVGSFAESRAQDVVNLMEALTLLSLPAPAHRSTTTTTTSSSSSGAGTPGISPPLIALSSVALRYLPTAQSRITKPGGGTSSHPTPDDDAAEWSSPSPNYAGKGRVTPAAAASSGATGYYNSVPWINLLTPASLAAAAWAAGVTLSADRAFVSALASLAHHLADIKRPGMTNGPASKVTSLGEQMDLCCAARIAWGLARLGAQAHPGAAARGQPAAAVSRLLHWVITRCDVQLQQLAGSAGARGVAAQLAAGKDAEAGREGSGVGGEKSEGAARGSSSGVEGTASATSSAGSTEVLDPFERERLVEAVCQLAHATALSLEPWRKALAAVGKLLAALPPPGERARVTPAGAGAGVGVGRGAGGLQKHKDEQWPELRSSAAGGAGGGGGKGGMGRGGVAGKGRGNEGGGGGGVGGMGGVFYSAEMLCQVHQAVLWVRRGEKLERATHGSRGATPPGKCGAEQAEEGHGGEGRGGRGGSGEGGEAGQQVGEEEVKGHVEKGKQQQHQKGTPGQLQQQAREEGEEEDGGERQEGKQPGEPPRLTVHPALLSAAEAAWARMQSAAALTREQRRCAEEVREHRVAGFCSGA